MSNDAMFVTGMSSANARRVAQKQKENLDVKRSKGAYVKPGAQWVLDEIAKEKANVVNIEKLVLDVTSEKNLQAQILAIQMHLNFLNNLSTSFKSLLRAEAKNE